MASARSNQRDGWKLPVIVSVPEFSHSPGIPRVREGGTAPAAPSTRPASPGRGEPSSSSPRAKDLTTEAWRLGVVQPAHLLRNLPKFHAIQRDHGRRCFSSLGGSKQGSWPSSSSMIRASELHGSMQPRKEKARGLTIKAVVSLQGKPSFAPSPLPPLPLRR